MGLWDVEYFLGRPSKIVYTDSNFPSHLVKQKLCDFEAMRATADMEGPTQVDTKLDDGSTVKTLEWRKLEHPTADVAHYENP